MDELKTLKKRIDELEKFNAQLQVSHSIPLSIDQAFRARFLGNVVGTGDILTVPQGGTGVATLTGIVKGNGTGVFTAIVPLAGTKVYYIADSSEGAVTRKLTFTNGILTAET